MNGSKVYATQDGVLLISRGLMEYGPERVDTFIHPPDWKEEAPFLKYCGPSLESYGLSGQFGIRCPGCQAVKRLLWKDGEYVYTWCRKCRRLLKAKQLKD